ncbi:glycine--tRNA ligase subunit beta [Paenibacillus albicereus]|uniref:Glycine--tRNA ligase beta subunit n=1 Tax=Paenibacillus albicereus TaxID=2726185 RepID=A0A6H2GYM8_9BACL|nr:glycine--tRNA ligase subunit beta [Paenibacillus albicereus]QJC52543.1 glycine--tRNA ligase subunit beta [Paenibacillus albicereus]
MAKDLLFEIGLEEVPARFVRAAVNQLRERVEKWLSDSRIGHGGVTAYATPRRLAVLARAVEEKQSDVSEEVKGPSRKIAQDAEGGWSKAALGFARSQGVEPEQLFFKELAGVEYVYAVKSSLGVDTASVLAEGLNAIVHAMTFPKNMRWGSYELKFVRPIKWLLALFGTDVVPMEIAGVKSGNASRGHRFLGEETRVAEPAAYVEALRRQHVIVDIAERERLIVAGIEALAADKGWTISIKDDLLEEVLFLVETPTVLFGSFDPAFLDIPQEVLITSMREHQRYFPVLDSAGKLLPYFVTVRNGDSVSLDNVARGNEKVLRARLSDAKFFYAEDQKLAIADALRKLESIVYHEELGTVADKVGRIVALTGRVGAAAGVEPQAAAAAARAAEICKFDLVTQMVYEFPELQGIMGEDYARKAGEDEAVAKAINEHYQPRFSGDTAPASLPGSLVSLADKLDTIVGCFSIGIIPTGSQDPYALRRQAAGIVQTLMAHELPVRLGELFDLALDIHEQRGLKRPRADIRKELYDFFALRLKNVLTEQGNRYDVIDAALAAGFDDLTLTVKRAAILLARAAGPEQVEFKTVVDALTRSANLAAKAESDAAVDAAKLEAGAERRLHEAYEQVSGRYRSALDAGDAATALGLLTELREPITAFFDSVMVMAEDEAVRRNRLALLSGIAKDAARYADFSKLVWA